MTIETYVVTRGQPAMQPHESGDWVRLEDHQMAMDAKQISWDILYHSYKEMKEYAMARGWRERDDGSDE